jgi:hypothetical protein
MARCLLLCVQGYMPGQLYKLDSCYGNSQQLKGLLQKLKDAGIDPLADIVINHRYVCATDPASWISLGGPSTQECILQCTEGGGVLQASNSACQASFWVKDWRLGQRWQVAS